MSKNLTRKGLAFGALVALGSTVIAGAPAYAEDLVVLEPVAGSSYTISADNAFTLKTFFAGSTQFVSSDNLKVRIVDASLKLDLGVSKSGVDIDAGGSIATTEDFSDATTANAIGTRNATTGEIVAAVGATAGVASTDWIKLVPVADETFSVTVQTWVDVDNDNLVDDGATRQSQVRTVNFVKSSDVTWSVDFVQPKIGDTKFEAYVNTAQNINLAQVTAAVASGGNNKAVGAKFTKTRGAASDAQVTASALDAGSYQADTGKFKVNPTVTESADGAVGTAVQAGTLYVAQAYYVSTVKGDKVSYTTAATKVDGLATVSATAGTNVKEVSTNYIVRAETKSVTLGFQVYSELGTSDAIGGTGAEADTKAGAGIPVTVTIANTNLASTTTITAGGKNLTSTTSGGTISFEVLTNASGVAEFTVASSTGKATDQITVSAKAENDSATGKTVTWAATSFAADALVDLSLVAGVQKVAKEASYSLTFALVDNFGVPTSTTGYRVYVTQTGATGNNAAGTAYANLTRFADVVNGKATISLTAGTTGSSLGHTFRVKKYNDATTQWEDVSSTTNNTDGAAMLIGEADGGSGQANGNIAGPTVHVGTVAAAKTTTLTATNSYVTTPTTTKLALTTEALKAADLRVGETGSTLVTEANSAAGNVATLAGQVTDAFGANTHSTVTLSAPGVLFVSGNVRALNAITVNTNSTGAFGSVKIYSTKAGKVTVTATAGAATKTVEVEFQAAAKTAGVTLDVAAPAYVLPGQTLTATVSLVDAFGNPVAVASGDAAGQDLTIAYDGPGFLTQSITAALDANGKYVVRVILGAGETGTAKFTATYSKDGVDTNIVTKTATTTIGAAPVVSAAVAGGVKVVKLTVRNAANQGVVVTVNGKTVIARRATSAIQSFSAKTTAGKKTVVVKVAGKTVATRTVTVK